MRALVARYPTSLRQRSGDGGTIEQRGRLARQALKVLGDANRSWLRGLCDGRQIGRDRRNAEHGAARSHGALAVVLMLGVPGHGMAGIGVIHRMLIRLHRVMQVRGRGLRLSPLMHMRGGGTPELMPEARDGVAGRQRHAGREHAKQIEQGGKPPRLGARRSRQANEHGGNLTPVADFAKGTMDAVPSQLHAQYRGNVA